MLSGRITKVKARVELPAGRKMLQVKSSPTASPASNANCWPSGRLTGGTEKDGLQKEQSIYQWDLALPTDPKDLIEVVAGTDAPTAAFRRRDRAAQAARTDDTLPEMYVVCVGINRYADPKINSLGFPVADAEAVADAFRNGAAGLYHVNEVKVLENEQVTPAAWTKSLADLRERLKDRAQPDDLVVFFLAGHGIVDEATQKYYYVGHDFTLADLERKVYKDCISWTDFGGLADVPCRKVVLLDTCHSGAIQPLRSRNLKTAVPGAAGGRDLFRNRLHRRPACRREGRMAARGLHALPAGGPGRRGNAQPPTRSPAEGFPQAFPRKAAVRIVSLPWTRLCRT